MSIPAESPAPPRGVEQRLLAGFDWPEVITLGLCLAAVYLGPFYGIEIGIVAVIGGTLEFLFPYRRGRRLHRTWRTDAYHAILTSALSGGFTGLIILTAGGALRTWLAPWVAPLQRQPFALQIAEMLIIFDFAAYVFHVAEHKVAWLWRFHSVHHSIEDLNWLAAYRVHPVDATLNGVVSLLPIYVLGMTSWPFAIAMFTIISAVNTPWAHGNLRVSLGPLWWVIRNPEYHRWHHSAERAARDRNFAQTFVIWDIIFRTVYFPRDRAVGRLGLPHPAPDGYAAQLLMPFTAEYHLERSPAPQQ